MADAGSEKGLLGDVELTGEVLGLVYADTTSGFGVVELEPEVGDGARCAGPLAQLVEGQTVRLVGRWETHPRYGRTFQATFYEQVTPTSVGGLESFLRSERFDDVPDAAIARVLTAFGAGAGRIIEHEPGRLAGEAGIDAEVADILHRAWMEGLALAQLIRLVEPARIPLRAARAVHAHFGPEAATVAREDPFALLEVEVVRFAHADSLARQLGFDASDPRRLAAAPRAALAEARRRDGHQLLPRDQLVAATARLLGVDAVLAVSGVDAAVANGAISLDDVVVGTSGDRLHVTACYPPAGLDAERDLARHLRRLGAASPTRLAAHADAVFPSDSLTDGQSAAVRAAFDAPVSVLTGGPGTGKTRTIEEVVLAAEAVGLNVALCAPTGRAAKRLEELVGRPASTIHRLLEARPAKAGGFAFGRGPEQPLPHDLVVADEVSMCDTALAGRLVAAVEDGAHLLLVGDPDQLPSVGPGDVLRDLLRSEAVPVARLTEIHRQAVGSRVVALAREIDAGEVGVLAGRDGDVFLAEESRHTRIVTRVVAAVAERAEAVLGVAAEQVQVVAPVYRGPVGVDALNTALKATLNPPAGRPQVAGFHVGDRAMQTRNDPERDVSNGDIGTVVDVSVRARRVRVAFPRGEVACEGDQLRQLTPAWAITIHKSQGGEWPVVVFVCDRSHVSMLWRNLAYTAVTRAQRGLVLVGQAETLRAAARQDRPRNRYTALAWRLAQA